MALVAEHRVLVGVLGLSEKLIIKQEARPGVEPLARVGGHTGPQADVGAELLAALALHQEPYTVPVYSSRVSTETDAEDISAEWETIKALPRAKNFVEDTDLRVDRKQMGVYPEYVYQITDKSYGLRFMALWKLRCHGQKFYKRGGMYGRETDCWIVQYHRVLWEGPGILERRAKASVDGAQPVGGQVRYMDPSKTYSLSKRNACASLDEALDEFEVVRDQAIERYREEQRVWRESIAKLRHEIDDSERVIARFTGFIPQIDDAEK